MQEKKKRKIDEEKYMTRMERKEEREKRLIALENEYLAEQKTHLPEYLEEKLQEVAKNLANVDKDNPVNPLEVYEWIKAPTSFCTPKYTTEELAILFDYYTKTIAEINKKTKYPPTKPNFCLFCGIATSTYDKYLNGVDIRKKDLMERVDQYIRDMQLTLGETGNLNPIVAMYRSKSEHGMYEAQAPKTVHFEADVDVDKIKAQIAAVNRAGHLNMTEGADGVYRTEE